MAESKGQDHWYVQLKDVKVPEVDFREMSWKDAMLQRLHIFLAPTTSRAFTEKEDYFRDNFADQVRDYSEVRKRIKQLYLVYRSHRHSQLNNILGRLGLEEPPAQWDDEIDHVQDILHPSGKTISQNIGVSSPLRKYQVVDAAPDADRLMDAEQRLSDEDVKLLDEYCDSIKRTRTLRSHLKEVEDDLTQYAYMINTQATAELTYFRGFRDWCQVMLQLIGGLSNSLIAISTLGAGLAYSTIFGASRGNVALMCYCFPFFVCGFLLPVVIQILLQAGAGLQKEVKFAAQQFWTIVVGIFMSIATLSLMASLILLSLTVFLLREGDTPDQIPSRAPGIIVFGIMGSVFMLVLLGALVSAIAARAITTLRGIRAVVAAMYGSGGHQDGLKVWLPV
ncbi:hypothetical protein FB45DRAFT_908887 [Roridomyces roridus]|uniref:Uncharacterized protein n=1 Tax=Roridomyces roridus TaxID=1738132 RepID=A0AAD7FNM4_9AGAR|nr:hypothetical protein FB45DRAFT_908887 [Roridomyces roridus]